MRTTFTTLLGALTLIGSLSSASASPSSGSNTSLTTCKPHPATPQEQQEIWNIYADLLFVKRTPIPAFAYIAPNEIQHDPFVLDGTAAAFPIVDALLTNSSHGIEVLHQAFVAPFGWVHWRLDGVYSTPAAVVELYRFDGGCVVEHWDVTQQVPTDAINPHPLF
ncbi:hypothetical protein C8R46DRAFT_1235706 [Mycena filopes]|nr:hypothetical protein C8R46DRAFT_1235706 [Mycena filopes]